MVKCNFFRRRTRYKIQVAVTCAHVLKASHFRELQKHWHASEQD